MPAGRPRRTQTERSQATTAELVATARRMFGDTGYAATAIDDIAQASGMTKGAVYHHFPGKSALFRAVFELQERHIADRIASAASSADSALDGVRRGAREFLEACTDHHVRQIILLDGPAVLGWDEVRAIEYEHTLKLLQNGLTAAAGQEQIFPGDARIRAHLLFGALCELGMLLARADHPVELLPTMLSEADELVAALVHAPATAGDSQPH